MLRGNPGSLLLCLLLASVVTSASVELLNLKAHWAAHGVSFLYPKHIKLLSNRLKSQAGLITSFNPIPGSDMWEVKANLHLKCAFDKSAADEDRDVALGIFLTRNNPRKNIVTYTYDNMYNSFGMSPEVEGLSLVFTNDFLYTGLFKTQNADRDELTKRAKICKAYLQKTGKIMFSIRYRSKVLGIYIAEEKEKYEHLCYQFTDIEDFSEFYLTFTAVDREFQCSADVYDLSLQSNFDGFQFVANEEKKADEPTYTYFTDSTNTQKKRELDHFHTVYDYYRDNAKIFAKSLLTFADYNEKEVVHEMRSSIQKTEKAIDDAIAIVELEARQLEALNGLLSSERRSVHSDVNETLDQILKWLQTMDGMFDKVDQETQTIHQVLVGLNFDEKLDKLVSKVQSVGDNLSKAIGKTKSIVKPAKLSDIDDDQIEQWKSQVNGFQEVVNEKLSKDADEKMTKVQMLGLSILGVISVAIMGAFVVMWCKIRMAIRNKRML